MTVSYIRLLLCLVAGIVLIVALTTKFRVHAFFALLIACFGVGLGVGLSPLDTIAAAKDGFGNVMKSLGLIIVLGTALGVVLDATGSTAAMATFILRKVGERRAPLAMCLTGFVVGLPIFCDSGYIVLSGLNRSLVRRTGAPAATMAVALAAGLYSVHCLIPPHPGAMAAAGILGVDLGQLILYGIVVAVPASAAGYLWAKFAGKDSHTISDPGEAEAAQSVTPPPAFRAFLPVVVPVVLIALKSFLTLRGNAGSAWMKVIGALGDPVIALAIGVLLAFGCGTGWTRTRVGELLQEGAEKAGGILVIIGAGGAFGAVLAATKIGDHLGTALPLASMGLLFPFLLAAILKSAQGSSTVAILTSASIVLPLLPALGLATDKGHLLCALSLGAGSMTLSQANDAYFWVIAKFSGLDVKTMFKVHTVATGLMGIVALAMIYLLSMIVR
jgi:GntP family gluconate:H+ symporter